MVLRQSKSVHGRAAEISHKCRSVADLSKRTMGRLSAVWSNHLRSVTKDVPLGLCLWLAQADLKIARPMSPMGKTGKALGEHMFSALPPKADSSRTSRYVRIVPQPDSCTATTIAYSITSSASASKLGGTTMPSAFAVF